MENDLIRKMFSARKTKFNIGTAMDEGALVVIDNAQAKLGEEGCTFLGRFFISRIWAAATARHARQGPHRPVFVYIDEAQLVMDSMIAKIIDECRSARVGLILAHQHVEQIKDSAILGSLQNCAIKMVNANNVEAEYFSKLLDIPLERMKKLPRGHFATDIRWEGNCIMEVPKADLPFEIMSEDQELWLQWQMAQRFGFLPDIPDHDEEVIEEGLVSYIKGSPMVEYDPDNWDVIRKGDEAWYFPKKKSALQDDPITHKSPTEAELLRVPKAKPAEADKPIVSRDPSAATKWSPKPKT
jgi:hypothetical protein